QVSKLRIGMDDVAVDIAMVEGDAGFSAFPAHVDMQESALDAKETMCGPDIVRIPPLRVEIAHRTGTEFQQARVGIFGKVLPMAVAADYKQPLQRCQVFPEP